MKEKEKTEINGIGGAWKKKEKKRKSEKGEEKIREREQRKQKEEKKRKMFLAKLKEEGKFDIKLEGKEWIEKYNWRIYREKQNEEVDQVEKENWKQN